MKIYTLPVELLKASSDLAVGSSAAFLGFCVRYFFAVLCFVFQFYNHLDGERERERERERESEREN